MRTKTYDRQSEKKEKNSMFVVNFSNSMTMNSVLGLGKTERNYRSIYIKLLLAL